MRSSVDVGATKRWDDLVASTNINFVGLLLIVSLPMLGTVLLIVILFAIISRFVSGRRSRHRRKREKEAEHIERFLMLVIETKKEQKQLEGRRAASDVTSLTSATTSTVADEDEDDGEPKWRNFMFMGRRMVPFDLRLPDENKVPMELVNEAIAKSMALESEAAAAHTTAEHIQIDQEVVQLVNQLIRPTMASLAPSVSRKLGPSGGDELATRKSNASLLDLAGKPPQQQPTADATSRKDIKSVVQQTLVLSPRFYLGEAAVEGNEEERDAGIEIVVEDFDAVAAAEEANGNGAPTEMLVVTNEDETRLTRGEGDVLRRSRSSDSNRTKSFTVV